MGLTSHPQSELFDKEYLWADSLAKKLREVGENEKAVKLEQCHQSETFCHCLSCGHVHSFLNRCDRFYCPLCCSLLSYRRKLSITAWAEAVNQPKHLVLTARNREHLSKNYVKFFKTSLSKLRRLRLCSDWRGGLASLEVTNEGRGWHLHCHLLVDVDWLPMESLAPSWAKLLGQDFAIVAARDVRDRSYLQEVTKYAVKGSELASWRGETAKEFIYAFEGVRQFSTFGSLYKDRALRKALAEELSPGKPACKACSSDNLRYLDHNEEQWLHETGQWPKPKW
jgi:hypothetical protein